MAKSQQSGKRRRIRMANLSAVLAITLVMSVIGILMLSWFAAGAVVNSAQQQFSFQVVLFDEVKEENIAGLKTGISKMSFTREVNFISREAATAEYLAFAPEDDFMEVLGENPLPQLFEVFIRPEYLSEDSLMMAEQRLLAEYPLHIEGVFYDAPGLIQAGKNIASLSAVLLAVLLLLGIIMVALINHAIGLELYSKRFLIKTMQLVGATSRFIRRPFIWSGVRNGLIGGLLSAAALAGLCMYLFREFPETFSGSFLQNGLIVCAGLPFLASFFSWLSTRLALSRHLRRKIEELY
jgi:cell division transport system permease protein